MKWLQWMSRMFMITVFATVISMVTTWVMVDLYAEQLLKKFNLSDLRQNVQFFDVLAHLSEQTDETERPLPKEEQAESEDELSSGAQTEETDGSEGETTDSGPLHEPQDAVAVWGQVANLNEIVISADEFNKAKDDISPEDKIKIFSILSSHMTDELMMQLSVMMEGGLTRGELAEIERMMQELLDEEQYNVIMGIISPYITQ